MCVFFSNANVAQQNCGQMGDKKRLINNRRHVRGVQARQRSREQRPARYKEAKLRAVILRLRTLERDGSVATIEDRDDCFCEVRQLAITPNGLLTSANRRVLWPFLLGASSPKQRERKAGYENGHRDAALVEKDVERSLWHYDILQGVKESERRSKRRALTQLIMEVLHANETLFYFQGYHDIVSVFLLTLGNSLTTGQAVQRVSETYQREPMRSGFEQVMATTNLLFPLLDAADELLFQHLRASGVEPFFALPWMITWFSHQLKRFEDVARLFDVFLVTHPLFSLYVSAGVVLEAREKIVRCECDFGTMHGMLSSLPHTMDVEKVIARALVLFHQLPPEQLRKESEQHVDIGLNMYFQFPFEYQPWPSVAKPMLDKVPPLPSRRSRHGSTFNKLLGSWQTSVIATTVAISVIAVVCANVLRDRSELHT